MPILHTITHLDNTYGVLQAFSSSQGELGEVNDEMAVFDGRYSAATKVLDQLKSGRTDICVITDY